MLPTSLLFESSSEVDVYEDADGRIKMFVRMSPSSALTIEVPKDSATAIANKLLFLAESQLTELRE